MQITLDGFVAGPNDENDWIQNSTEEWADLKEDLDAADTFLLGRKMYPGYSKYWQSVLSKPDSNPNELTYARLAEHTPHIVFTKGDFKPDWKNTQVAKDPAAEIRRLKSVDGKNIIAWGGADFAASLIRLDLVDEYRFVWNPLFLAKGKTIFQNGEERKKLSLIRSKTLNTGAIIGRYRYDRQ